MKKRKSNKKTNKFANSKETISAIKDARDGGQIALSGYSYQFLYSCYLSLSEANKDTSFQFEGIEDIDRIITTASNKSITHIQLKYSRNRQDASFMKSIFKNFMEIYLLDQNREFKLVYDFPVAKGNLSKLFDNNLDDTSRAYWKESINRIKNENCEWDWSNYEFDSFISRISFENISKNTLESEIVLTLIKSYNITTDNLTLFANSIKILCFNKMEHRDYISLRDIEICIQSVKEDISKGAQNPAHSWISKITFSTDESVKDLSYYEGKKATPTDIENRLPVRRQQLEKEIINSIQENNVTVIKSASGQGKTTLALQAIHSIQKEYTPYQLSWCNDIKELGHILQYFKTRIQLGEKPIILIDNLDSQFSKWNELAQKLQAEIKHHYKILVTTREMDWYNFSGNKSDIHSLNIIKPVLSEKEAKDIFSTLKNVGKLHFNITDWKKAWNKVSERKLLIEYVYLLTHGEMLSDRISAQMKEIGNSPSGKVKCEILRKVCFADICGIRLQLHRLIDELSESSTNDYGEIIKSMEEEFLLKLSTNRIYIEGLHPVRSSHIVSRLHEYYSIDKTALSVVKIADNADWSVLFSYFPQYILNKIEFYAEITDIYFNKNDLSPFIAILEGLFSGSIINYYTHNKEAFDDANSHGGLFIFSTELCPFTKFDEFNIFSSSLETMLNVLPNNKNIKYLINLKENTPKIDLPKTDIYQFCGILFNKLDKVNINELNDLNLFSQISEWLYNINHELNLSNIFSLDDLWDISESLSLDCMSSLMYISYCRDYNTFIKYVENNFSKIVTYLKHRTNSHNIYTTDDNKKIHVDYILRISEINKANDSSVERIKAICKTLPIFDKYCADAIKPSIDALSAHKTPDDAHKEMPIKNVVIMFHQKLNKLWNDTIMSNYEFDSIDEWIEHWYSIRNLACDLMEKGSRCLYKLLAVKQLGGLAKEFDSTHDQYDLLYTREIFLPKEKKPFSDRWILPEGLSKIKSKYFQSILNYTNQFVGFIKKDNDYQRLCVLNLKIARSNLNNMQMYFSKVKQSKEHRLKHQDLCKKEVILLNDLINCCLYYQNNEKNEYFNKQWVTKWNAENTQKVLDATKLTLENLQHKYSIDFPIKSYEDGVLTYYPIVIKNFDISKNDNYTNLLISCIPFAESDFDNITIIFSDDKQITMPSGLVCPKVMLNQYKLIFENNVETQGEELKAPFPIEITEEILNCFEDNYKLGSVPKEKLSGQDISFIAEDFWVYSKTRELLTGKCDSEYCKEQLKQLNEKISKSINSLEKTIPSQEMDIIKKTYNEVLNGKNFDNKELNEFVEIFS